MATREPADAIDPTAELATLRRVTTEGLSELDAIHGVTPDRRPLGLRRVAQVLHVADAEADALVRGREASRADTLRLLRSPGGLGDSVDPPSENSGSTAAMIPILGTWAVLGFFELRYAHRYARTPVESRPPFFADWLAQPWYQGPILLSLAIVLSVTVLGLRQRSAAAPIRQAARVERALGEFELALAVPVGRLWTWAADRDALAPQSTSGAADLRQAARDVAAAATTLGRSAAMVSSFDDVLLRIETAMSALVRQSERLATAAEKVNTATADVDTRTEPLRHSIDELVETMVDSTELTRRATDELSRAARSSELVAGRIGDAEQLTADLQAAQTGLTTAVLTVRETAVALAAGVTVTGGVARELRDVLARAEWVSLVLDGLDPQTGPPREAA